MQILKVWDRAQNSTFLISSQGLLWLLLGFTGIVSTQSPGSAFSHSQEGLYHLPLLNDLHVVGSPDSLTDRP